MITVVRGVGDAVGGMPGQERLHMLAGQVLDATMSMQSGIGLSIGLSMGLLLVSGLLWRRRQIRRMLGTGAEPCAGLWRGPSMPQSWADHADRRREAPWTTASRAAGQQTHGLGWLVMQGRVGGMLRRSPASWGAQDRPRDQAGRDRRIGTAPARRAGRAGRDRRVGTAPARRAGRGRRPPRQRRAWTIEFCAPGEGAFRAHPATIDHIVGVVREAIGMETGTGEATVVVAVAEKGGIGIVRLAPHVLLTPGQQRRVQTELAAKGYGGRWKDDRTIRVRMLPQAGAYGVSGMLWIPVMEQRGATVWWPLHGLQHLILAGESGGVIEGVLATVTRAECMHRPRVMVFDPQQLGRDITDDLSPYLGNEQGLARARIQQLRDGFQRSQGGAVGSTTLLVVIMPRGEDWSDLEPLLHDTGGLHVLLVVGSQEPIPQLRGVCHRMAVVEAPSVIYPGLPDAFRPATLAGWRDGQVMGWTPGESFVWRGTPLPQQVPMTEPDGADAVITLEDLMAAQADDDEKGAEPCQDG